MATENGKATHVVVAAHYNSPSGTQVFEHPLSSLATRDAKDKSAYLNMLRSHTKNLQEQINTFLTSKMEEEKRQSTTLNAHDQEEEEANYGEEKVEEEED